MFQEKEISTESNKQLVRRILEEVWHKGDMEAVDRFFVSDHHDPDARDVSEREGYKALARTLRGAFPDLHITINQLVAEGDVVAKHWTARATPR